MGVVEEDGSIRRHSRGKIVTLEAFAPADVQQRVVIGLHAACRIRNTDVAPAAPSLYPAKAEELLLGTRQIRPPQAWLGQEDAAHPMNLADMCQGQNPIAILTQPDLKVGKRNLGRRGASLAPLRPEMSTEPPWLAVSWRARASLTDS